MGECEHYRPNFNFSEYLSEAGVEEAPSFCLKHERPSYCIGDTANPNCFDYGKSVSYSGFFRAFSGLKEKFKSKISAIIDN